MTPEELRRALLALLLAPDPDAQFLGWRSHWPHIVRSAADAYGSICARFRFDASPADLSLAERVAPALAWLRRERGEADLRLVLAWALETPPWRLAQRLGVTPRTVRARTERALAALVGAVPGPVQLGGRDGPKDWGPLDSPLTCAPGLDHPRPAAWRAPPPERDLVNLNEVSTPGIASPSRVWVSGSWFTNGRRHRERAPSK